MKRERIGWLAGSIGILLVLCSPVLSMEVVRFGVTEVRSGPFKSTGDRHLWGIEAAVAEANASGGLLGKKIELVVEDNQLKGDIAVQKLEKLILQDNCQVIIQGSSSVVGGAIAQAMPKYKKLYVNTGAMAMAITGENFTPYQFRVMQNAGMHVKGLAQSFAKKPYKKVFLLNQDYSWGYDVANYYEKFIKALAPNTQIVGKEFHKMFNKDFAPYISKIQASGADYVITGNWGTDLAQFINQSREMGLKIPIGCTFLDDDSVMSVVQENALGCLTVQMFIPGLDRPRAKALEESFSKYSGGKVMCFASAASYLTVKLYMDMVKKAGTFDTETIIRTMEGFKWDGPAGPITIRKEDHQAQLPLVLAEVVKKTKYFDHPYVKPVGIIPAEQVSLTLEECGWKPWGKK
jgi:branched-chain amino acid transport system substrate-binding protein